MDRKLISRRIGSIMSNIEDSFEKIYRDIGKNGLNEALKSTFTQFNELVESGGSAAKTDRKSTRLNSSHSDRSRMPSSA